MKKFVKPLIVGIMAPIAGRLSDRHSPGLLGGNQQMLDWMRGTSPLSSNTAPLTNEEMMRLNQMAGIRGPSWLR